MSVGEKCERCGAVGQDRRTLWMACFYAMNELGMPFKCVGLHGVVLETTAERNMFGDLKFAEPKWEWEKDASTRSFFTLRVCKGCRAEWMTTIRDWFRAPAGSTARFNNDARDASTPVAELVALLETVRVEHEAIGQRITDSVATARAELERLQKECQRP